VGTGAVKRWFERNHLGEMMKSTNTKAKFILTEYYVPGFWDIIAEYFTAE